MIWPVMLSGTISRKRSKLHGSGTTSTGSRHRRFSMRREQATTKFTALDPSRGLRGQDHVGTGACLPRRYRKAQVDPAGSWPTANTSIRSLIENLVKRHPALCAR